jgi:hypothetical protein
MITSQNLQNLYNITANLAYKDYRAMNPKGGKKHRPYSLSGETREALELYALARTTDLSREDEERIKAYLFKIIMGRPELLEPRGRQIHTETKSNT